jgi:hypothetical protein
LNEIKPPAPRRAKKEQAAQSTGRSRPKTESVQQSLPTTLEPKKKAGKKAKAVDSRQQGSLF